MGVKGVVCRGGGGGGTRGGANSRKEQTYLSRDDGMKVASVSRQNVTD